MESDLRRWMRLVEDGTRTDLVPVLYHGTDVIALCGIIMSDRMTNSIDTHGSGAEAAHGVSLTFDQAMAWSFADRSTDIWDNNHLYVYRRDGGKTPVPSDMTGAVLVFDTAALVKAHKIARYYDDEQDDEAEERVITANGIDGVSRYLISFTIAISEIDFAIAYLSDPHCPQRRDFKNLSGFIAGLHALKSNPLRRGS